MFDRDEAVRADTTAASLAALKPAFKKDGTVTAGNAPGVNDGASALVVMSAARAAALGLTPLARIVGQATSGLAPKFVLMTPVEAVRRVVLASDGPREEHEAFVHAHGLAERPYILSRELGVAFQVGKLPYAVLIDAQGVLRARGLVNTREHVESLFEAMDRGVGSVQEYLQREGGSRHVA